MNKQVKNQLPIFLKSYFWSVDFKKLNINKDKEYIIHQILCFGDLKAIKWLFGFYGEITIKRFFTNTPVKIYRASTFNWVKNVLLGLENKNLNINRYVINTPRITR